MRKKVNYWSGMTIESRKGARMAFLLFIHWKKSFGLKNLYLWTMTQERMTSRADNRFSLLCCVKFIIAFWALGIFEIFSRGRNSFNKIFKSRDVHFNKNNFSNSQIKIHWKNYFFTKFPSLACFTFNTHV